MDKDLSQCPICGFRGPKVRENPSNGTARFDCPRCKVFVITDEALMYEDIKEKIHANADKISGLSRLLAETGGQPLTLFTNAIDNIIADNLIPDRDDVLKKASILLKAIRRKSKTFGNLVQVSWDTDFPLAFATGEDELIALLDFLDERGYIRMLGKDSVGTGVYLTVNGWMDAQIASASEVNQGFIVVWFDPKGSMDPAIKATEDAIREVGFQPMCIRDEHYAETILEKAIGEIIQSRFVVVNLTGARNSVFFEAGFAQGRGIEIIYVCDRADAKKAPDFYSKHYKIYFYGTPEELKEHLISAIKARLQ